MPPPRGLKPDKATNQTNAQANKRNNDKHQNKRIASNSANIITNPTDSTSNNSAYFPNQTRQSSSTSLQITSFTNESFAKRADQSQKERKSP